MSFFVRVDANARIGMGHFARSLAVAVELRDLGAEVVFLTASEMVAERLVGSGFRCERLGGFGSIEGELPDTLALLERSDGKPDVVLVDTYEVSAPYVAALSLRSKVAYLGSKTLVADGLSAVINYSFAADEEFYEAHYPDAIKCLGARYAPIGREFWERRRLTYGGEGRLLLMSGGSDRGNILGALADRALGAGLPGGPSLCLAVGAANGFRDELLSKYAGDDRVEVLCDVGDMAALMDRCSLAVTAGGTTTFELCARRLPFVVYSLVPEQDADSLALARLGVAPFAGSVERDGADTVAARACALAGALLASPAETRRLREAMATAAPENGAKLIAEMLMDLQGGADG